MIQHDTVVVNSTFWALKEKIPLVIHQGGTSSGKTFGIMDALIQYARQEKERKLITVVAINFPYVRRDSLRAFHEIVSELKIKFSAKSFSNSTFQIGQCTFEFLGMEDPMKASHGKRDILFINEAYMIPYMVYRNLAIRTKQTAIIDYNPHEDFWLHDQVLIDPTLEAGRDYLFKRTTYRDNPAITEKQIKDIEGLKTTNPNLYKVLGLGLTGTIEGLVFPRVRLVDQFPKGCKREGYGLDFGYSNDPTACVRMGLFQGELYLEEVFYEKGLLTREIIQNLFSSGVTGRDVIYADAADPRMIQEIKNAGFNIRAAEKGPDSIKFGIDLINEYQLNLVKSSANLRKEQKNYRYKTDKTGKYINKPIEFFNHGWDAARYIATPMLKSRVGSQRRVTVV